MSAPSPSTAEPAKALEEGMEWVVPLLAFKNPRKTMSVAQVRAVLDTTTETVRVMIHTGQLQAFRVTTKKGGKGKWQVNPASVVEYLWRNQANARENVNAHKAVYALVYLLTHHLSPVMLRLLRTLVDERLALQEKALEKMGLKVPEKPAKDLAEVSGQKKRGTGSVAAPTNKQPQAVQAELFPL